MLSYKNFGFNFPWWDKFFGSYLGHSAYGENFPLGLETKEKPNSLSVLTKVFEK